MFLYTRAALNKIVSDLRRVNYVYNIISPLFSIFYLIYACVVKSGLLAVNIALGVLTLAWLIIYLAAYTRNEEFLRRSKHIINRAKIAVRAFSLGVAVYGIYIASEHVTVFSILFASVTALGWIGQVVLELLTSYIEAQVDLIIEGFKADMEGFTKPVRVVESVIKRVTGRADSEEEAEKKPSKRRLLLEEKVGRMLEERRRKKEEKKQKKLEEKLMRKKEKLPPADSGES